MQTKQWLDKCYGKSSPLRQMVEKWIGEFKRGHTSTNDDERSERQKDVITSEIMEKIYDIALDNSKMKMRKLAEAAGISIGTRLLKPETAINC